MATAEIQRVREYETIYVLSPTTPKEASDRVASRVEEVMEREGGQLTLVENWGRRQLAYPVAKHRRGVYVYLKYTGHGALIDELERNFRMLDPVLKFQTVKLRDDVDPASIQVDHETVKFESIEPVLEEEAEESLEQQLGLAEPVGGSMSKQTSDDSSADGNGDEGSDDESEPRSARSTGEEEE